jgi:hypothetical protein
MSHPYRNTYESAGRNIISMTHRAEDHMTGSKGKAQNTS